MNKLCIIRTSNLINIDLLCKYLKRLFPSGIAINLFKIGEMINPDLKNKIKTTKPDLILSVFETIDSNYSPVFFIGYIGDEDLLFLKEKLEFICCQIYFSSYNDERLVKNKITYSMLNTNDWYTRYKSKNKLARKVSDDIKENKFLAENKFLSYELFDLTKESLHNISIQISNIINN